MDRGRSAARLWTWVDTGASLPIPAGRGEDGQALGDGPGEVLQVDLVGFGPPRTPVSSVFRTLISSAVSSKSKTSKFSVISSGRTDFGIALRPSCRCQRIMTCAGVLPRAAAIEAMAGSSKVLVLVLR